MPPFWPPSWPPSSSPSTPDDQLKEGLILLAEATKQNLLTPEERRSLKDLLFDREVLLIAAVDAFRNDRDLKEFADTARRIFKAKGRVVPLQEPDKEASAPFSSSPATSSWPLFSFGGSVVAAPPPRQPETFGASTMISVPLFKPAPVEANDNAAVSQLLNQITVRQEGGEDHDDEESPTATLQALRNNSIGPELALPSCATLSEFESLCGALEQATAVHKLRFVLERDWELAPLCQVVRRNKALSSLDLSHSSLSPDGAAELLSAVTANPSITSLNLEFCKIEENQRTCAALERLLGDESVYLVKLNLDGNYLGDDAVTAIAAGLRRNRSLQLLHLATNMRITPLGLKALVDALDSNTSLQGVHLYGNPNLRGTPLIPELLAKLQANMGRKGRP